MKKKQQGLPNEYFGNPVRIKEYRILFYAGLVLMLTGIPILFLSNNWNILSIVLLFTGLMCLVAGWLGYKEEKKAGIKKVSTPPGKTALFIGVISMFFYNIAFISIILGAIAIILSITSIKKGDNEYGPAGGIAGVISIIVNLYVTILFIFFD